MNAQTLTGDNSMCTDLPERKGFMVLDLLLSTSTFYSLEAKLDENEKLD